jgi:hypothetical protein
MRFRHLKFRTKNFDTYTCLLDQPGEGARLDRFVHGNDYRAAILPHD